MQLPSKPGVYIFKDSKNKIIYVGKAKDLKKRVSSYFIKGAHDAKTTHLVSEVKSVAHIIVSSELEAFLLEAELIKKNLPYYNVKMADDKSYPYIIVAENDSAYVAVTRKKSIKKALYFGPYPDSKSVQIVLKLLRRIFPYQSVKNHPKRKCLYFHLGLCPCIPAVPSNLPTYRRNIKKLTRFLSGDYRHVLDDLQKEQKEYIKREEFEEAGRIQKQIDAIQVITQETYDPFHYLEKPLLQIEREEKENKNLLEVLQEEGMPLEKLHRIECYDISNIQGTSATGSMVTFINGEAVRGEYKRFQIKGLSTPNDFKMHQEMMKRRLSHPEWGTPDLIIIDGGKGQVTSVMQILVEKGMSIPIIGLAKRFETIVIPQKQAGRMEFVEVRLPLATPAVNLVRRIRDEAHRFAITYHRLLRSKRTFGKKMTAS